jgi:hypothetical protein
MKSMLPDHPVAITGLLRSIASAGTKPNPSLRCSESTISAAAVRAKASARGQVRVSSLILGAPSIEVTILAKSDEKWCGLPTFITRIRSVRSPKAARKAAIAPSGFLRSKDDAKLRETKTTSAVFDRPKSARPSKEGFGDSVASGSGTTLTRPGISGSNASAVNRDGAQTSWTKLAPGRQLGDATGNSQAQTPTTRRSRTKALGSLASISGNNGGLTCKRRAAPSGGMVVQLGGGGRSGVCAGNNGPISSGHVGTPRDNRPRNISRALSPRPEARENSPTRITPPQATGGVGAIFGAANADIQASRRRRRSDGNVRHRR